jgi:hypothetical protein
MGSLRASDTAIINELRDGFTRVESRLDQIYNHIDGCIKLHETLDIEFKVIKEPMRRLAFRGVSRRLCLTGRAFSSGEIFPSRNSAPRGN